MRYSVAAVVRYSVAAVVRYSVVTVDALLGGNGGCATRW